jgi:hypothetical protein
LQSSSTSGNHQDCPAIPAKFCKDFEEKTTTSVDFGFPAKVGKSVFFKNRLLRKSEKIEFGAVQRFAKLVDLVKRFPTSIYLQKSAWIQLKRASTSLRYRWGSLGSLGSFSSVVSKGGGSR